MDFPHWLAQLLRRLLQLFAPRRLQIKPQGARVFARAGLTTPGPRVAVRDVARGPAAGVPVRFEVLKGGVIFANGAREITVRSDVRGVAQPDIRFGERGAAIIAAWLPGVPSDILSFRAQTEGTTRVLDVDSAPTFPVDPGEITVRISASDADGEPVLGARLTMQAIQPSDTILEGTVRELGNGRYEGKVRTHKAGEWSLRFRDTATGIRGRRCVHVLPGPAVGFKLGNTNPRLAAPRGELTLHVLLVDAFGNALDPQRIALRTDAGEQESVLARSARFLIRHAGFGNVNVRIRDRETDLSTEYVIGFDPVAFGDPGLIEVGTRFRLPLYVFLPPDRPITEWRVDIGFNAELARFAEVREAGDLPLAVSASVAEPTLLSVSVVSSTPLEAASYSNGVYVADLLWDCLGEGETCFEPSVWFSPQETSFASCYRQKRLDPKPLCINFIVPPEPVNGHYYAAETVSVAVESLEAVFNAALNIGKCCPVIVITPHTTVLDAAGYLQVLHATDDGTVTDIDQLGDLADITSAMKPDCLNIWLLRIDVDGDTVAGCAELGGNCAAIDPVGSWEETKTNVFAHEVGHMLGLGDDDDDDERDNTMYYKLPNGPSFTKDQCETIWNAIGQYSGR